MTIWHRERVAPGEDEVEIAGARLDGLGAAALARWAAHIEQITSDKPANIVPLNQQARGR